MKRLLPVVLGFAALIAEGAEDPRRAQSAEIAACFQKVLGERPMSALTADGLVAAIEVCQREAQEIATAIARHDPNDQATGLSIGNLRGAFVVAWPAASGGNRS